MDISCQENYQVADNGYFMKEDQQSVNDWNEWQEQEDDMDL